MSKIQLDWALGASPKVLKQRASFNASIRSFFSQKAVLEVETPILGQYTATDAFTASLRYCSDTFEDGYLQTSAESYLKQYIAEYPSVDVFNLGKVFREDLLDQDHQAEFTMLEWYRHGFNWRQLSDEVVELIEYLNHDFLQNSQRFIVQRISYQECFKRWIGECPFAHEIDWFHVYNKVHSLPQVSGVAKEDQKLWRQLLWTHLVEPNLCDTNIDQSIRYLTIVYDYPTELAIMAKVGIAENDGDSMNQEESLVVAKRFEIYFDGVELANGWEEENSSEKLESQMNYDLKEREKRGLKNVPMDIKLLSAINKMQEVSGVAIGVDRLFAKMQKFQSINQTLAFYA